MSPMVFNPENSFICLGDLLAYLGHCLPPSSQSSSLGFLAPLCPEFPPALCHFHLSDSLFSLNPSRHHRTTEPCILYLPLDGLFNPHGCHYHPIADDLHTCLSADLLSSRHKHSTPFWITHWDGPWVLKLNMFKDERSHGDILKTHIRRHPSA